MEFKKHFHANGKLLLTGEYFVLDGAVALALPTKLGQSLQIVEDASGIIAWRSFNADGSLWFEGEFDLPSGECQRSSDEAIGQRLAQILQAIATQNSGFFQSKPGLQIETHLDFPREWGLGTSSTLIANLAQWACVDPFQLLQDTFGGSGYDIACANAEGPVLYQLENQTPKFESAHFDLPFKSKLFFVYLGKKQNSREGIARYRAKVKAEPLLVKAISSLTFLFLECTDLSSFEDLICQHEKIVANTLELRRAKDLYFADFWGEVKSLGAWGGDFVLVTSDRDAEETRHYLNEKRFSTVLPYKDLIL